MSPLRTIARGEHRTDEPRTGEASTPDAHARWSRLTSGRCQWRPALCASLGCCGVQKRLYRAARAARREIRCGVGSRGQSISALRCRGACAAGPATSEKVRERGTDLDELLDAHEKRDSFPAVEQAVVVCASQLRRRDAGAYTSARRS